MEGAVGDTSSGKKRGRFWRPLRYVWILGIALGIGIVWHVGVADLRAAIRGLELRHVAILTALILILEWSRAGKWRYMLGAGQNALGIYFLAKGAGHLSPGRLGELSPLMLKRHRTHRVGAWIVLDRISESATTLGLGAIGFLFIRHLQSPVLFWALVAALIPLLYAGLLMSVRMMKGKGLAGRWGARFEEGRFVHRLLQFLEKVADAVNEMRGRLGGACVMTVTAKCLDILYWCIVYKALGYDVPFALAAAQVCLFGLMSAIPFTPVLTGVPYVAGATLVGQVAGVSEEALTVAAGLHLALTNLVFWSSAAVGSYDMRHRAQ